MRLINPSFEILKQQPGLVGAKKMIELAARMCYKSEKSITEDSYEDFLQMLSKRSHYSPWEFGTIYLIIPVGSPLDDIDYIINFDRVMFYKRNHWSKVVQTRDKECGKDIYYITTNYRVILENDRTTDLQFLVDEPSDLHPKRIIIKFITSIGIVREILRHRGSYGVSFINESTRYCNYSKNKYANQITYIIPTWLIGDLEEGEYQTEKDGWITEEGVYIVPNKESTRFKWLKSMDCAEQDYIELTKLMKAELARDVLPLATKSELLMCAYINDWEHFFDLRCDKSAHPDIRYLAKPLKEEFIKRKYLD